MGQRILKIGLCLSLLFMHLHFFGGTPGVAAASATPPKLVAGYYHTVSLVSGGQVFAWGEGNRGQIGDGTDYYRIVPVMTRNLSQIVQIDSGVRSSMALRADGTVWTWGLNENGQLGIGTLQNVNVPTRVTGLDGVHITAISGGLGYHSMALAEDGTVWTWGRNNSGELGDGTVEGKTAPVQVQGLTGVTAIAAGGYHSLALKEDGTVWAWGTNGNGEVGDGTQINRTLPVQVAGLSDVVNIAAGGSHSLAVKRDGTVWSWGYNLFGVLGDGTGTNRGTPVQVLNLDGITDVAGGGYHSLALDAEGRVWSWGRGDQGQLGRTDYVTDFFPARVEGLIPVTAISAGGFHSIVMTEEGRVWGWGLNSSGQLGDGTWAATNTPVLSKAVLDTTAPQPGGPIEAGSITDESVELEWTGASDNLSGPDKLEYRLYMSGRENLNTVGDIERNGLALGDFETKRTSLKMEQLVPDTTYYFNVIVRDSVGNKSAYPMKKVKTRPLAPLHDVTLRQLSIHSLQGSELVLEPAFSRFQYNYSLQLAEETEQLTVTADVYDIAASVTASVYDEDSSLLQGPVKLTFGEQSEALMTGEGAAYLTVNVSTPDGQEQEYRMDLIRDSQPGGNPGEGPGNPGGGDTGGGSPPGQSEQLSGGTVSPPSPPPQPPIDLKVLLSDQPQDNVIIGELRTEGGHQAVLLKLDSAKLKNALGMPGSESSLLLVLGQQTDSLELSMDAEAAALLAERKGSLELRSPLGGFRITAAELAEVFGFSEELGSHENSGSPAVIFKVGRSTDEMQERLAFAGEEQQFTVVASPIHFDAVLQNGSIVHSLAKWNRYVERSLPVPPELDGQVTTGILVDDNGTVTPVPTRFEVHEDGSSYAVLQSDFNGAFALIAKKVQFSDTKNHWAEEAVQDLASRMIIIGTDTGRFSPAARMDRAAFTALMTRALGLYEPNVPSVSFADVSSSDWFHDQLAMAGQRGWLEGDGAGYFHPAQAINRQEAFAILARIIEQAGLATRELSILTPESGQSFKDLDNMPKWARTAAEKLAALGILEGSNSMLQPKQALTRAEATVLVQRMLKKSGMID